MKLSMGQVAELIGCSVDVLRHKVKHSPWRVPSPIPRNSNAAPFKWDAEVVRAWMLRREDARKVSGNHKLLYLGSAAVEGMVRDVREQGGPLSEREVREIERLALLDALEGRAVA